MTKEISISSLLEELSKNEENLRKKVTLPDELRSFIDEFYEKFFSEDTTDEEKILLSKFKGFVLYFDCVLPVAIILSEYVFRISDLSFWASIITMGKRLGTKANKDDAFEMLMKMDNDELNKLQDYLGLDEEFKQCIQKKDRITFYHLLKTTGKTDDLLYGCNYIITLINIISIGEETVFGNYSQTEILKVKRGYLLPIIRKMGLNLSYSIEDSLLECEEIIPYELVKEFLRRWLKFYIQDDKELMLDTEIELLEEAARRAQNFEDAFYPVYFSVLIEQEGDLNRYIDYWIEQNGEDCDEVKRARAYMDQLTFPREDTSTKKGRKQGCWLKGKPIAEEHSWAIKIQTKVWDKTLELARSFDYVESLTEKKAEKKYKEMAAALIYKSAEIIGVANPWDSGVQSSYERTMNFAKIDRRYLKKYLDILDYYLIAKEFQIRENHFLYRKNEYNDNIIADYQEEDDDSNYALSIYQSRTKHIFPSGNDMKQLRERRSELIQSLADSGTMANFISINFKAIGSALSIVKQIMKKIK